jgi:hypothetical protein
MCAELRTAFLDALETTPMTRSFKMLVLRAMLEADPFPGEVTVQELTAGIRRVARRSAALQRDLGVSVDDDSALQSLLERNPIEAWVGGKGTGGSEYFSYSAETFRTTFDVNPGQREAFAELVRELVDWRLAEYLDRSGRGEEMAPQGAVRRSSTLETGRSYMRAEIPATFGLPFESRKWQQGFVSEGGQIFLLVTLEKEGMPAQHRYSDRFLSRELFEWKSQNRHTQESSAGQAIRRHVERDIPVHLLVRKEGKVPGGTAAPFIYCGLLTFVDWEGEKPITIRWRP